jgi:S1-C subfamily serine protease
MRVKAFKPVIWLVVFVMAVGLACNAGSNPAQTQAPAPTQAELPTLAPKPTQAELPTDTPTVETGEVTNLQDVEKAVVRVEMEGTYVDPEVGLMVNVGGWGTGFIIDPSGIAVTNNHVVTGSALLRVYMSGETKPLNARVLGVSECSDLAVIKIDGDNFPYLKWYDGDIKAALDVYAAGYPSSAAGADYTVTKGIVSQPKTSLDSVWASVDNVIKHSAKVNPGNSGGPLVDDNGQVLGINYATVSNTDENYAISRDAAESVVEELRSNKDKETIGVNGIAVTGDLNGTTLSGVWVRSVKSGSPADKAGIQGGDIIYQMEGEVLAPDANGVMTMKDYCDILRSHNPGDTLSVTVVRFGTGEVLEGQLNGRELTTSYTFGSSDNTNTNTGDNSGTTVAGDPNATGSGSYFFSTEFDDADNWYTFAVPDSDNYSASVNHSTLYMEADDKNSTVYAFYDLDLAPADVRIDAAVETVAGPNRNNISLVCRATEDGWYEFSMNSGGYWYIWKYSNSDYTMLNSGASTAINLQKSKNELIATCIGTDLSFYVNGVKMGSTRDNRFQGGGQVGVSVSTFDISGAGVEFDWLSATVP